MGLSKIRATLFWVLITRILLFRVLDQGPLFRKLPDGSSLHGAGLLEALRKSGLRAAACNVAKGRSQRKTRGFHTMQPVVLNHQRSCQLQALHMAVSFGNQPAETPSVHTSRFHILYTQPWHLCLACLKISSINEIGSASNVGRPCWALGVAVAAANV